MELIACELVQQRKIIMAAAASKQDESNGSILKAERRTIAIMMAAEMAVFLLYFLNQPRIDSEAVIMNDIVLFFCDIIPQVLIMALHLTLIHVKKKPKSKSFFKDKRLNPVS